MFQTDLFSQPIVVADVAVNPAQSARVVSIVHDVVSGIDDVWICNRGEWKHLTPNCKPMDAARLAILKCFCASRGKQVALHQWEIL